MRSLTLKRGLKALFKRAGWEALVFVICAFPGFDEGQSNFILCQFSFG